MKPCLLDTYILSLFFRNHPQVVHSCNLYLQEYRQLSFSLITHYEILSGLKHRDAQKQLDKFLEFSQGNQILLLTDESVTISAKIYADLRKQGTPLDDIDLLIAGVAIANNLVLITHNQKHFSKIEGLELEDWTL
ncbi:type II toxin-antitoxin system VapC family toxin [Microcystis sp. LEGE 08355]|uniref:type II toxin-antitoxin system VapC family toxin n=1 Tax=Microcystis sp. LEGE 08355 TaxID=1828687 RepID=UPI001882E544|nr:type II toxin-antitoxin system VapC family toxin [Microcystis sp. LEGE 08355]MBE9074438.1 type II toxin-antitoxin system VapC family toxin [Microcystis sp. LEGE 08355]